jgi:hypothetical protein
MTSQLSQGENMDLERAKREIREEMGRLAKALTALESIGGSGGKSSNVGRTMSAAARRRISAAQKVRWAKWKKQKRQAA